MCQQIQCFRQGGAELIIDVAHAEFDFFPDTGIHTQGKIDGRILVLGNGAGEADSTLHS